MEYKQIIRAVFGASKMTLPLKRRRHLRNLLSVLIVFVLLLVLFDFKQPRHEHEDSVVVRAIHGKFSAGPQNREQLQNKIDKKPLQLIKKELDERIANMTEICDELIEEEPCFAELYDDTLKHIYVLEQHKLMFCYIPKVGCSNWKRILMILEDATRTIDDISSREAHARNNLTMLEAVPPEKREWMIENFRKFMFVRHPLSRIVSAYKNKFQDIEVFRAAPILIRRYGMRIKKKYRKNATPDELRTGENVTWSEWLKYISDPTQVDRFDRHWKEMYKLCSPCAMDYDYVGKLENIHEEADFIMDALGISHLARYPGKGNSHPTNTSFDEVVNTFSRSASKYQLKRISEVYGLDFCLFGYDKPDILP